MKKGFTLIELLIVVAIIAILAAIAVPNFLEAQIRAKVSRVKSDQRSVQVALETYYIDNNAYPLHYQGPEQRGAADFGNRLEGAPSGLDTTGIQQAGPVDAANQSRPTFAQVDATGTPGTVRFFTLTTPIAYITSYTFDPFSNGARYPFTYVADGPGWVLVSWGPNADQPDTGDADADFVGQLVEQVDQDRSTPFDGRDMAGSLQRVLVGEFGGGAMTYDPTNGTTSPGDVWRMKE